MNYSYDSGVVINVCADHGVWLDKGELERIEAYRDHWSQEAIRRKDDWLAQAKSDLGIQATPDFGVIAFLKSIFG